MLKYRIYLFITAFIWGSTFIFQRLGADTMGAFGFAGIRFLLGSIAILPLIIYQGKKGLIPNKFKVKNKPSLFAASFFIGFALFAGTCLQQMGLAYTTAGKSAFITALYIIIVPLMTLFFYHPLRITHVIGIVFGVVGVYLLAFNGDGGSLNLGDLLTLISAFCWSTQIILIDRYAPYYSGLHLALGQFLVCAVLCIIAVIITGEPFTWEIVEVTAIPLLYSGIMSSGVAFTLQIIGQAKVPPTEGSMIMSLEMVFAVILGYFCLGEVLNQREIIGAICMIVGVFICQLPSYIIWVRKKPS